MPFAELCFLRTYLYVILVYFPASIWGMFLKSKKELLNRLNLHGFVNNLAAVLLCPYFLPHFARRFSKTGSSMLLKDTLNNTITSKNSIVSIQRTKK